VELLSLPERYARLACLDMSGAPVQSPEFAAFDCYLFGNEARGLPREPLAALEFQSFTITGTGAIESLNLAATVNMCVYELNR
jgi:TrmH family RNA methyltransferase